MNKNKYKIDSKVLVRYEDGESRIDQMLAILLINEVVFTNTHWWKDEWPPTAKETISLAVGCNDCFIWGCSDAEEISREEIPDVFEHWEKDPSNGPDVWCIKKRNMMPQKPVYDAIMKAGIWNLDEMYLQRNPTWPEE
jgi:hypothetical protein